MINIPTFDSKSGVPQGTGGSNPSLSVLLHSASFGEWPFVAPIRRSEVGPLIYSVMKPKNIEFNADDLVSSVGAFAHHLTGKQKLTLRTVGIVYLSLIGK